MIERAKYEESLSGATDNTAIYEISNAELLIIAGTSLRVYLAESFIRFSRANTSLSSIAKKSEFCCIWKMICSFVVRELCI